MIKEQISLIKALQDYFTNGKYGKKVEMDEFKALTDTDKADFRMMLTDEGYDLLPPPLRNLAPKSN